jgi:hypothetical protein
MPSVRTVITEVITGLGTLSYPDPRSAVAARAAEMVNVSEETWLVLEAALDRPEFTPDFERAWASGRAFRASSDGLRSRVPVRIEWKGAHQPPDYEFVPADLRIDHVFLISCKYRSRLLANLGPAHLFDRALTVRGTASPINWYREVAGPEFEHFYSRVREQLEPDLKLPDAETALTSEQREEIGRACRRVWPGDLDGDWRAFSAVVSDRSAARWSDAATTLAAREVLLWRMLRLSSAPYFVLGGTASTAMRLRIATPWDWRQDFRLLSLDFEAPHEGQPLVRWLARVLERSSNGERTVAGHVEIRWSHGRFSGHPEAKLYLDTPHHDVPGYYAID